MNRMIDRSWTMDDVSFFLLGRLIEAGHKATKIVLPTPPSN